MNRFKFPLPSIIAACCGLAALPPAFAWGELGHEIVAVIAYARLLPSVRRTVDEMLASDDDPLTGRDFVSRSTWADRYRDSDRNTSRARYEATHQWHFVNIQIEGGRLESACPSRRLPPATPASAGPAKDCVVDKIKQFAAELRNPDTPKSERILALKYLLHFVGDLHQPLHAADHHDRGGNDVNVLYGNLQSPVNLHSYWDTELVYKLGRNAWTSGSALNGAINPADVKAWSAGTPARWARESHEQAKQVAYNFDGTSEFADDRGAKMMRLDGAYEARALSVAKLQLSKAGVRLAAVLNRALRPQRKARGEAIPEAHRRPG
jgi:hypothetical protein